MALLLVSACFSFSYCNAQSISTTDNLIQPYGWQGCLTQYQGFIWGGTSGGPCPVQRSGDGAILWSYSQTTLSQTIAVNQALSGTGITVNGYSYGWTLKNANAGSGQNPSYDPFTINVSLYDSTQKQIESKTYDYSTRIDNWTRYSGTEDFKSPYSIANLSNLVVSMTSRDAGYWAGYYGPEINYIDVRLRYSVDQCIINPLSSPSCAGYAQAYKTQQCAISALYDPSCPGYFEAFKTQQCTANPLYDPSCPGYAVAYYTQQCSINPLYNSGCPGYATAYFNNQCSINPLSDPKCSGYQQAYFSQQCNINPLYNINCAGYNDAYKAKLISDSCQANPQISPTCPGYKATSTPTVSMQSPTSPVTVVQDPVKSISETPLVSDPVVNQVLTTNSPTTSPSTTTLTNQPSLGTGLTVPGLSLTPQRPTSTARAREQAVRTSLQTASRAEQVVRTEQEKQQDAAMASLGNVPGFDAYQSAKIPDAAFYATKEIYRNNNLPDNARAQRQLNQRSDRLHREMIESQYNNLEGRR